MKTTLILTHYNLVKKCKYEVARKLLKFLKEKRIKLYLSDIDNEVERILEKKSFKRTYCSRGVYVIFYM